MTSCNIIFYLSLYIKHTFVTIFLIIDAFPPYLLSVVGLPHRHELDRFPFSSLDEIDTLGLPTDTQRMESINPN